MQVIPAMDLKSGQCVHSHENAEHQRSVVAEDPLKVAARWVNDGVKRLHLIDIDGYRAREPINVSIVRAIKQNFPDIVIDVIGGVHNEEHILIWLDSGVDFVIASAKGVQSADYFSELCIEFPNQIMLAVDLIDGHWTNGPLSNRYGNELSEMATALDADGLSGLICTNSNQQNLSQGIDTVKTHYHYLEKLPAKREMSVFLNGAIHCLKDVAGINHLKSKNIDGIIVGRAIYDDMLDFKQLQKVAD
jgi:phosphoribosylformimino-5-aminoimidazole carboxamide ribotide isomerase